MKVKLTIIKRFINFKIWRKNNALSKSFQTEMRKPLIRVLMDLGVQTAILIRDSNVIEKNKKDIVNNKFWADNRNACGLNISDIDYMTDTDKEIVQRNKNIVLDMCDGKI